MQSGKQPFLIFLVLILLNSCSVKKEHGLPGFLFNQKSYHALIVNRVPNYGITGTDGCLVMQEMRLAMSDENDGYLKGIITDATTGERIAAAAINFIYADETNKYWLTDAKGQFSILKSTPLSIIETSAVGYRKLTVNVSKRNLF